VCRNITILHGLEPGATEVEIRSASLQYVRKVSGIRTVAPKNVAAFESAVDRIAEATTELLATLVPRRQPPTSVPPLRRPEVVARISARARRADDM
jgi:hypothetical protein